MTPPNQDKGAVEIIRNDNALQLIEQIPTGGKAPFMQAMARLNVQWASFPGSPHGQYTQDGEGLWKIYETAFAAYSSGSQVADEPSPDQQPKYDTSSAPAPTNKFSAPPRDNILRRDTSASPRSPECLAAMERARAREQSVKVWTPEKGEGEEQSAPVSDAESLQDFIDNCND